MNHEDRRNPKAHGQQAEIIGAPNKCTVFVNGATHPAFNVPFTSVRYARIRFLQWAANVHGNKNK